MRNYWLLASCLWLLILSWVWVLVSEDIDSRHLVCIAGQTMEMDGTIESLREECLWISE